MKTRSKILATTAAVVVLGTTVAMTVPTLAHGPERESHREHGYGMMGQGHGMMGQGHGMMGQGHDMMSRGFRHGFKGDCDQEGKTAARNLDLSVADVKTLLEGRLIRRGNDRLKVGKVEQKDDNTIVAEIVTVDNSLVDRYEIDRKTGRRTRVK